MAELSFRTYLRLTMGTLLLLLSGATLAAESCAGLKSRTAFHTQWVLSNFEFFAALITEGSGQCISCTAFGTFALASFTSIVSS